MKSFGVVVRDELAKQVAKLAFAEDDEVPEALVANGPDEPLGVGIAVGAALTKLVG